MKKLAVCGCSFMTSSYNTYQLIKGSDWPEFTDVEFLDSTDPVLQEIKNQWKYEHNLHFTDLYIQSKKFEYINLAYGGASNFLIRLQLDQAIKFKPDYVIVAATSSDRIEIPLGEFEHDRLIRNYDRHSEQQIAGAYNKILSPVDESYNLAVWPSHEEIIFDVDQKKAIKYYYNFLANNQINASRDYYIIQSGLRLLESLDIPYVFLPGPLKKFDWSEFTCWPEHSPQPWDYNGNNVCSPSGNHLPSNIHRELAVTLDSITLNWNN